jgi:cytochrome c-type biogenesis protein
MDLMQFFQIMSSSNLPLVAAFFIGLMMAISPCPLATNITAIAYISRRMGGAKNTFITGLIYTLGRAFIYAGIAALAVWVGISAQSVAFPLQHYGGLIIGPFLIVVGILMLLSGRITKSIELPYLKAFNEKIAEKGLLGAFVLGAIFALAFCPFSAVLFFGMLLPIVMAVGDVVLIPSIFALGTGLPVIVISVLLSKGIRVVGAATSQLGFVEKWVKIVLAAIFIIVGIYSTAMTFLW